LKRKIYPDINISELVENYPKAAEVLTREYGLHCINCIISEFDTLREGASIHGIEGEDFEQMLDHLNSIEENVSLSSSPSDSKNPNKYVDKI